MNKNLKWGMAFLLFMLRTGIVPAQNDFALLNKVLEEDSASVRALALYPGEMRDNIFLVCTRPEALVRIGVMQKKSTEEFRALLGPLPKEEQEEVWDLTRYPGLMDSLAGRNNSTRKEILSLLESYPEETRKTALKYAGKHPEIISGIAEMNRNTKSAFESLIRNYPEREQQAFREIIRYPELVSILTRYLQMSILVGDIYGRDPGMVRAMLDSINLAMARENAENLEAWKSGLEGNPQAKSEFEALAKEQATARGYETGDLGVRDTRTIQEYVVYPYPYWYGFPWWWDYPYWYPYPYWYDWGFYYGPHGIVIINMPSYWFVHWHFYHPRHFYHYPHFTDYCLRYYYGRRRSYSSITRGVGNWVRENEPVLPKGFLNNDAGRPDRLKELGRFEVTYGRYLDENPGKVVSKEEYLKANRNSFPRLSGGTEAKPYSVPDRPIQPGITPPPPAQPRPEVPPQAPQPRPQPDVAPQPPPARPPSRQPSQKPKPEAPKPPPVPAPRKEPSSPKPRGNTSPPSPSSGARHFLEIIEAQSYHAGSWND